MAVRPASCSLPLAGASGFASPADEYAQTRINLSEHLISHPEASFILISVGNTLNHLGIFDGDYLVVDKSLKPAHQNIVIVNLNGHLTVKHLLKLESKKWVLQGGLETKALSLTEDMQIWGVVKWVLHKV